MPPPRPDREPQRIAKLLARAGIASRREIERMIAEGRVAIAGKVIDTPATLIESLHEVTVDGRPVRAPAPARLFRFHKPPGFLTTERDPKGRPTIYDRLPRDLPRLMPVGRLDLATEGLLLMTTDGELKRQLELPKTGVPRTYRARAYGTVTQAQLEELIHGVEIEGVRYGSINANMERRTGANGWIEMTLTEGKNREVRRVLEYLGLQVSRLIRTSYGPFVLGDLPAGGVDEVRQHDLVVFRKTLGGPPAKYEDAEPDPERPTRPARAVTSPERPRPARAEAAQGRATRPGFREPPREDKPRRARPRPDGAPAPARSEKPRRPAGEERPRVARSGPARDGAPAARPARSGPARDGAPSARPPRSGTARDDAPSARPPRSGPARDGAPSARPPRSGPKPDGAPARTGPSARGGSPSRGTGPSRGGTPSRGPFRGGRK